MKNPSKQEISHEKNKKNSARFLDNERYFTTFRKLNALPDSRSFHFSDKTKEE